MGLALLRASASDPTCNAVNPATLSYQSYVKTAHFFLAVENALNAMGRDGRGEILAVLSNFFMAHRGQAAGMWDLVAAIQADTGFDPSALAQTWLRSTFPPSQPPRLAACP